MILNDEQKAMLEGKYGAGAALAMKVQIGIGECCCFFQIYLFHQMHTAPAHILFQVQKALQALLLHI